MGLKENKISPLQRLNYYIKENLSVTLGKCFYSRLEEQFEEDGGGSNIKLKIAKKNLRIARVRVREKDVPTIIRPWGPQARD